MASLTFLHIFMWVSAFTETHSITSEDALAAQRLYEHAPPELQEIIEQLLQDPDLEEEAEQGLQQPQKELDSNEREEDVEEEEPSEDMAADDGLAQDSEEVEEEDETGEQEAQDAEEVSEDAFPEMVVEESQNLPGTHRDEALDADDAMDNGMDFFGAMGLDGAVEHFENPWAFVNHMQAEGIPNRVVEEVMAGVVDSVKQDVEAQGQESGEMLVVAEQKVQLPHVGEVGAKNTVAHEGEPLMIRDAADDESATTSISQRALLQLNEFSFKGNVLNRSENVEDMGAHWIVQFCPHWWEPCVSLTDSFAKVGHKLEEQLNTDLFMRNIRFATVDCASEKVLCNEQDVQSYPTTRHYYKGEFVAGWFGGQPQHEEFYTKWLMQQADGITPEMPDGYVVGNLTNSTTAAGSSEKKKEQEVMALPAFQEIAVDLLLVALLLALCTRAVLSNPRLWQGPTPQQQQQQRLPQLSESSLLQEEQHEAQVQEPPKISPTPPKPGTERWLPSSRNSAAKSMEL